MQINIMFQHIMLIVWIVTLPPFLDNAIILCQIGWGLGHASFNSRAHLAGKTFHQFAVSPSNSRPPRPQKKTNLVGPACFTVTGRNWSSLRCERIRPWNFKCGQVRQHGQSVHLPSPPQTFWCTWWWLTAVGPKVWLHWKIDMIKGIKRDSWMIKRNHLQLSH